MKAGNGAAGTTGSKKATRVCWVSESLGFLVYLYGAFIIEKQVASTFSLGFAVSLLAPSHQLPPLCPSSLWVRPWWFAAGGRSAMVLPQPRVSCNCNLPGQNK